MSDNCIDNPQYGLVFDFAAGPLGSLLMTMVDHWIGNFLFNMVFLIIATHGDG